MAKTLSFTDTSARTVKIGDTTTSFTLICGNDNVATDLTNVTSITVKLGNDSGYLKSATVDPTSLTDPTTGQVTVTFNADLMTSLTAGSYAIEVWVADSTGTSIYPSDGSTGFNITNNIQSANGSTITTITFDDFVKEMKEIASTIKGEKGDTGTVDNAGLTTAPAFVALQTQVGNSAVGTQLGLNTSDFSANWSGYNSISATVEYNGYPSMVVTSTSSTWRLALQSLSTLSASTKYTISFYAKADTSGDKAHAEMYGSNTTTDFTLTTGWSRYSCVVTSSSGLTSTTKNTWYVGAQKGNKGNVYIALPKLEKGSVATDWCLNPTEVLTQSDYAKIKAAIVALGGSLS